MGFSKVVSMSEYQKFENVLRYIQTEINELLTTICSSTGFIQGVMER